MNSDEDRALFNCQTCGACCHGDEGWVHVSLEDDVRLDSSDIARSLILTTVHGGFVKRSLKMIRGTCAALKQSPTNVSCAIYSVRPAVCRELAVGSTACLQARRSYGF